MEGSQSSSAAIEDQDSQGSAITIPLNEGGLSNSKEPDSQPDLITEEKL